MTTPIISRTHAALLKTMLGENSETVLAFWRHLDRMTGADWSAIPRGTSDAAGDAAEDAATYAVSGSAFAIVGEVVNDTAIVIASSVRHSAGWFADCATAEIVGEAAPDSTDDSGKWIAVHVAPRERLAKPVSLKVMNVENSMILTGLLVAIGVGIAIVAEGGLSLFGVGVQLPTPSWGNIIAEGRGAMRRSPHIVIITSIVLFFTVMALNYLGDVISQRFGVRESVL